MSNMWKILAVLLTFAASSPAAAQTAGAAVEPPQPQGGFVDLGVGDADYALGAPDARVVIVEYASLTCPHCADFHADVLPEIRRNFVDTGKVLYVYRDFPLDRAALAGAMIARCSGRDRFFGFIDAMYASQRQWSSAPDPIAALRTLARQGGMSDREFGDCLNDQAVADGVLQGRLDASGKFGVSGTPTVFVNGFRYASGLSAAQYGAILESLLAKP